MALAVANVTKLRSGSGASLSGAISNMSVNSLMVATVTSFNGTAANHQASDSENAGNYSTITARTVSSGGTNTCASIHYLENSVSGSGSSGNASGGAGSNGITALFHEVTGASTSGAFTIGDSAGSTGKSSSPSVTVPCSTTAAILFASIATHGSGNPELLNENAAGSGGTWSTNSSGKETNGASFQLAGVVTQIVASSGSLNHTWQSTGGAGAEWATVGASFAAAAGGGGGGARFVPMRSLTGAGF